MSSGISKKVLDVTSCKTRNICSFKQFRSSLNGLPKVQVRTAHRRENYPKLPVSEAAIGSVL